VGRRQLTWLSSWGTAGGKPKPVVFVRIPLFTAFPVVFVEGNFVPVAVADVVGVDINVAMDNVLQINHQSGVGGIWEPQAANEKMLICRLPAGALVFRVLGGCRVACNLACSSSSN